MLVIGAPQASEQPTPGPTGRVLGFRLLGVFALEVAVGLTCLWPVQNV